MLSQLGIDLTDEVITKVVNAQQWAIEKVLLVVRDKLDVYLSEQRNSLRPEADQNRGNIELIFFHFLKFKGQGHGASSTSE